MAQKNTQTDIVGAITGFRTILDLIIKQEQEMLGNINAELRSLPKGTLCLWRRTGTTNRTYFSLRNKGKNRGITRDENLIYKLARSRYLSIIESEVETDLAANRKIASEILERRKRLHRRDGSKNKMDPTVKSKKHTHGCLYMSICVKYFIIK